MKSVAITGATSMIGVALINECIKNNVKVLALVKDNSERLGRLPLSSFINVIECDLSHLDEVNIQDYSCDTFYHFAWSGTSKSDRDDPKIHTNNIQYTLDAVELAHRLGCKKFIGAGSQAEYGFYEGEICPDTRVQPIISYGIAKYAAGKLSRKLCEKYGMTHIWGRIFSVYGTNDNRGTMIEYAINQFRAGQLAKFSAATQNWNYLYETDAGKIFFLLGEKVNKSEIYCVASEDTRKLKEFILEIRNIFGDSAECEFESAASENQVIELNPNIDSLINDINWKPEISFREGIKKLIKISE